MEIDTKEFELGCEGAFWLEEAAYKQAIEKVKRYHALMDDPNSNCVERLAASKEAATPAPLWQRICGLDPTRAAEWLPSERRQGLRKLIRAVERMYRAEVRLNGKSATRVGSDGPPVADAIEPGVSRIGEFVEPGGTSSEDVHADHYPDGTRSFAGRSNLFDPLPEICSYLGVAQRKLSALCREQTGLRIHELGDCIRAEKLRTHLRDSFRAVARAWRDGLDEREAERLRGDRRGAAWRFIRWMRGCGRGESRQKLAWELAIPTPARLGRASFVFSRETLEEVEVKVALVVLDELECAERPRASVFDEWDEEQGAQLSDVETQGEAPPGDGESKEGEGEVA